MWALVCAAASAIAFWFSSIGWIFYGGYLLAVLTAVLLAPAMSLWVGASLAPAGRRNAGGG
jgi:hypothetical protein